MRHLLILISFLMVFGLISCKDGSSTKVSKHGYNYTLFKTGSGELIQPEDLVNFNIAILHEDSVMQDSRKNPQPAEFNVPPDSMVTSPNAVVDALRMMRPGDSIVIYERIDTVKEKPAQMKDWKQLTYRIKVNSVVTNAMKQKVKDSEAGIEELVNADIAGLKNNTLKDLKTTPSGLKYVIHEEGKGPVPTLGENVKVHYFGSILSTGKKFDSSYGRGAPLPLVVGQGQVIPGWEEALVLFKKGSKATVIIPAKLAYGAEGVPGFIDPNSDLVFYMDLQP